MDCPLKTAPRFSRRLLYSRTLCNFPCHTPNCLCSPGMWWAVVLQRVAMKETQSDLKRKFRFSNIFWKCFLSCFRVCDSAICSEINIGARSTGKRLLRQRPSVPDFSRLCGRRSVKIHITKKNWKGFVADMQFAENVLPNKFLDKQSNKIVLVFPSAVLK